MVGPSSETGNRASLSRVRIHPHFASSELNACGEMEGEGSWRSHPHGSHLRSAHGIARGAERACRTAGTGDCLAMGRDGPLSELSKWSELRCSTAQRNRKHYHLRHPFCRHSGTWHDDRVQQSAVTRPAALCDIDNATADWWSGRVERPVGAAFEFLIPKCRCWSSDLLWNRCLGVDPWNRSEPKGTRR